MEKVVLNPDKYAELISTILDKRNSIEKQIEKKNIEINNHTKGKIKDIIGLVLVLVMLSFEAFVIFYPPLREFFLGLFKINIHYLDDLRQLDFWKLIGIYALTVVIESLIVCLADDCFSDLFGIIVLTAIIIVYGVYSLLSGICYENKGIKTARKDLMALNRSLEEVKENLNIARKKEITETKMLLETNEMFERGVLENDISLIEKAAAQGNPKAIKYIDTKEGERLYSLAMQGEKIDYELLEKAADLGNAYAIVEFSEYLFKQAGSKRRTNSERKNLRNKAANYLAGCNFEDYPDGRVVQIESQLNNELIGKKYVYEELLKEVRLLKQQKKISLKYKDKLDKVIKELISTIDYLDGKRTQFTSCEINDPVAFMERVDETIDKQLGVKSSNQPDGAFVPRIDVSDI